MAVKARKELPGTQEELVEKGLLSPVRRLILSKFDAGDAKKMISPGSYESIFAVDVAGRITVGEEYESQIPVPWERIAVYLLNELADELSEREVKRLLQAALKTEPQEEVVATVKEHAHLMLGKRPCQGKVTGSVVVRIQE